MVEDLGDTIGRGFNTWKNNLNICLPFVFNLVLTSLLAITIMGSAFYVAIPSFFSYLSDPSKMSPSIINELLPPIIENVIPLLIAVIITLILSLLVSAFFTSGAIGMAKEATKKGRTDLSDMRKYGKKRCISLFFANIFVSLLTFLGGIFLIPGFLRIIPIVAESPDQPQNIIGVLPVLLLGFLAMSIYILIISVMFTPSRYAIVIDDFSAFKGLKEGFKFFMANKVEVFLLFIIMGVAMIVPVTFTSVPYIGDVILMTVMVTIIQPLVVIWWSRLYLDISKSG